MASEQTSGSQTCTIDTVHTLATITEGHTYVLGLDLDNLAGGDVLEVEIWTKLRSGDSSKLSYQETYAHTQTLNNVFSVPVAAPWEFVAKIQQTDGTGRAIPWAVYDLEE